MKLKVLMVAVVLTVLFLSTEILYAANGDLIVNGNLGVGTSTPQGKAEVNGSMVVGGDTTMKGNTTTNGNAIVNGDMTMKGNTTTNGNIIVNGNLGVGTSTPTQKLDVNGAVRATEGTMLYLCPSTPCGGCTAGVTTTAACTTLTRNGIGNCVAPYVTIKCTPLGRLMTP